MHFENKSSLAPLIVKPAHDALAAEVASATGAKPKFDILKKVWRSAEKLASEGEKSTSILKDLTRSTLVVNGYAHAEATLKELVTVAKERFGDDAIVSIKNTIDHQKVALDPESSGYRDIKVVVRINGQPTEFQINTPEMLYAKALETPLFEKRRAIEAKAAAEGRKGENLTIEEKSKIRNLTERSNKIYERAIDKIENRIGNHSHH